MAAVAVVAGRAGAAGADRVAGGRCCAGEGHRGAVGASKPTAIGWKKCYLVEGIGGLDDRPKGGRRKQIDDAEVVLAAVEPAPARLGVTHWSSRLLAAELGLSHVTVAKVWKQWGLQPWRIETFRFSTDPELQAKVCDVVGLY